MRTKLFVTVAAMLLVLFPSLMGTTQARQGGTGTSTPLGNASNGHSIGWSKSTQREVLPLSPALQAVPAQSQTFPSSTFENFDNAWPDAARGWRTVDTNNENTDGGEFTWAQRNCTATSLPFSAKAAAGGATGSLRSCSAPYPANLRSWAVYGPFDLSSALSAQVTFQLIGRTPPLTSDQLCQGDFLFVGTSIDNNFYDPHAVLCGDTQGQAVSIPVNLTEINSKLGRSQVWLAFLFVSNEADNNYVGFSIDDVSLEVVNPTPTPTNTPTATPTNTPTPTAVRIYVPQVQPPTSSVPIAGPCNDVENANDLPTNRTPDLTTINVACRGSLQDDDKGFDDYYKISLQAGQTLNLYLYGFPGDADYDLVLYSSDIVRNVNADALVRSRNPTGQPEPITYVAPTTGTYYIRIFQAVKSASQVNQYTLLTTRS